MKNFLITQIVTYTKKRGYQFTLSKDWYDYSKRLNINLIPYSYSFSKKQLNSFKLSGIIFTGGNDLNVLNKNEENLFRDNEELKLLNYYKNKKIKILGICRGFQLIVFNFGIVPRKTKFHVKKNHKIYFSDNNYLKKKFIGVNSYHNYSINKLPKEFKNIASHVDKSIEIASYKDNINCFMFHPERPNSSQNAVNSYFKKALHI